MLDVVNPGCESRYRTLFREVANFERDPDGGGLNRGSGGIIPKLPLLPCSISIKLDVPVAGWSFGE